MKQLKNIQTTVRDLADPVRAQLLQRYFKTGPGEYAEGDIFLGLTVPQVRGVTRRFRDISLAEIKILLKSKFHEERLLALCFLVDMFNRTDDDKTRQTVYRFYLKHTKWINNWDLVDTSARDIVGGFLFDKSPAPLFKLAKSKNIWERRIAIIATFHFINQGQTAPTFSIAKVLLNDDHDLIHKATGWMLREAWKRDPLKTEAFLKRHYSKLPRTALRYAIERMPPQKRQKFLKGTHESV